MEEKQKTIKMEFILITDRFLQITDVREFPDVPLSGWALVNLETICKTYIHNPYIVKVGQEGHFSFAYEKHNIVKVYCRISDESLPRSSPENLEDPNP
jgi:hypothetical protein